TSGGYPPAARARRHLPPRHAAAPRSPRLRSPHTPAQCSPPPADERCTEPPTPSASAPREPPRRIAMRVRIEKTDSYCTLSHPQSSIFFLHLLTSVPSTTGEELPIV